jgi:hypothetical protein
MNWVDYLILIDIQECCEKGDIVHHKIKTDNYGQIRFIHADYGHIYTQDFSDTEEEEFKGVLGFNIYLFFEKQLAIWSFTEK